MRARTLTILLITAAVAGAAGGVGGYTFVYARGASYLTNDPSACANCHIMSDHYAAWVKSSHRTAAVCNDCHTPPGLVPKYMTKASNGFWHSLGFTTGRFPDPLRIKPVNLEVTEKACRACHQEIVRQIDSRPGHRPADRLSCIKCHSEVGHME
ncbi:MAG TPA: cytochrome c nitrite reductase small subunit [Thermoanaerobaculia bacterium]|nr:cytochrome c nitrite reductase small subunit [Thermoanaerobaculia bacterium]